MDKALEIKIPDLLDKNTNNYLLLNQLTKNICKVKLDKCILKGILCQIPQPVLLINTKALNGESIENNKIIYISFNNEDYYKNIIIEATRNIHKLKNKEYEITIIEIRPKEYELFSKYFVKLNEKNRNESILKYLFDNSENIQISKEKPYNFKDYQLLFQSIKEEYNKHFYNKTKNIEKNEIFIHLKIKNKDVNKKIYFLCYIEDDKNKDFDVNNNLFEFNKFNTKLYIDNKEEPFKKYFIPTEKKNYIIKLIFNIKLTTSKYMFYNCLNIIKIDLSSFNTENIVNMENMFTGCKNLTDINLKSFNTENVINMRYMFYSCENLIKINLLSFNTKNVIQMDFMFAFCSNLIKIDLSSFNFKNVKNMKCMFIGCKNLIDIDFSSFGNQNESYMKGMFINCGRLTKINMTSFNIFNNNTDKMFQYCENLNIIKVKRKSYLKIKKEAKSLNILIIEI